MGKTIERTPITDALLRQHAAAALFAQSACNLSGIVYAYASAMEMICEVSRHVGSGTTERNKHPIAQLFAVQVAHLAGVDSDLGLGAYSDASDICTAIAATPDYLNDPEGAAAIGMEVQYVRGVVELMPYAMSRDDVAMQHRNINVGDAWREMMIQRITDQGAKEGIVIEHIAFDETDTACASGSVPLLFTGYVDFTTYKTSVNLPEYIHTALQANDDTCRIIRSGVSLISSTVMSVGIWTREVDPSGGFGGALESLRCEVRECVQALCVQAFAIVQDSYSELRTDEQVWETIVTGGTLDGYRPVLKVVPDAG